MMNVVRLYGRLTPFCVPPTSCALLLYRWATASDALPIDITQRQTIHIHLINVWQQR